MDDDTDREATAQRLAEALAGRLRAAFIAAALHPGSIEAYVHDGLLEPLVAARLDEDEVPRLIAALAATTSRPTRPRGVERWQLGGARCSTCGPLPVTTSPDVAAHHRDTGHHVVERLVALRHHGAPPQAAADSERQQ